MKVCIKNLRAMTLLGAYAEERHAPREVVINLSFEYDHAPAVASDQLHDAIDYAMIERTILDSLARQQFILLESLAAHVVELVMGFAGVREVTVEIDKPGALAHAQSVSVVHTASA